MKSNAVRTDELNSMENQNSPVVRYAIDPGVSRLTVRAFATGLLSAFGHDPVIAARDFTGDAQLGEGPLEQAGLRVKVKAASLAVENDMNDRDRREMQQAMQQEFLETDRFPDITYDSSRVSGDIRGDGQHTAILDGSFTMHGVTRQERVPVHVSLVGDMLRASGAFTLRQSDYRIKPVKAVAGGLRLKDEVTISFDVVARKLE